MCLLSIVTFSTFNDIMVRDTPWAGFQFLCFVNVIFICIFNMQNCRVCLVWGYFGSPVLVHDLIHMFFHNADLLLTVYQTW